MTPDDHDQVRRAIEACRNAGLPVIGPQDCTCGLSGRLVVLAGPDGLRVVWPYEQRCPIHDSRAREESQPVRGVRATRSRSQAHPRHMDTTKSESAMSRRVPYPVRKLAAQLAAQFGQDATLARRLNAAQERLQSANDRLWWGLHPDGLSAVYGEDPAAVEVAFAEHRSEVLGTADPHAAVQHVRWQIHSAFRDYQTAAEERRQLAAETGELIHHLVHALVIAGWTEEQARNANVNQLATNNPTPPRRN